MTAVKGAQNTLQKPPWQGSNQGQRINNQNANNNGHKLQRQNSNQNNTARNNQNKARGEMIEPKSNAITARVGDIFDKSAPVPELQVL